MVYTLERFAADCRAALSKGPGPAGRELVRQYTAKASAGPDFVSRHLGPQAEAERNILYQDPDLHFWMTASVPRSEGRRRTITVRAGRCTAR